MTQTIEQLTSRIAELEEEKKELQALLDFDNARLDQIEDELEDVEYLGPYVEGIKVLKTQLAASQAYAEQLRDAARNVCAANNYTEASQAIRILNTILLAAPHSTSALDAYVSEKVKEANAQVLSAKNLLAIMHRDGGHHEFAVGFDQAVQDAMAVYYELTRQRDLAVEAITRAIDMVGHPDNITYLQQTLDAIKESEAFQQ